jgi:diguanylate cyclase (GGDEF)-like protein
VAELESTTEVVVSVVDDIPAGVVRERLLLAVVRNLTPAPFLNLPIQLLVSWMFAGDVSRSRLGWWLIAGVVSTLISSITVYLAAGRHRERVRPRIAWLLGASLGATGVVYGMAPWVAATGDRELLLLFTLFPAAFCAVAAVVGAGCRDLFLMMIVPALGLAAVTLSATGDPRLHHLALVAPGYGIGLLFLHHSVSKTALQAVVEGSRADRLRAEFERERAQLIVVNDQLQETNLQLAYQAMHDPLTGLLNRRGTLEELEAALARSRAGGSVALLFCDLDRFKAVNDSLGHRGGDRFICVLADRISRTIDRADIAGRMGGDEFVVVLPDLDVAAAAAVANRLVGVLAQPVHAEGREVPSSVSIGVAVAPLHGSTSSELLRHANAALYRAKAGGRNRVELFDGEMQRELIGRLETEHELRRAIDHDEIIAYFQPEVDAATGAVVGAELTSRWQRPDGTFVSGAELESIVRQAGLSDRLNERVLAGARFHIRRLAMLGLPDGFRFRVNITAQAAERTWRTNPIDHVLQGIDPTLITVDVNEATVMGDLPMAAANLAAFRARGGRVCFDRFARGVSSLTLLRRVPIDEVRIDRVSIDTITAHPHDRAIVRSIIALVRELGIGVTAEGVDTGAQADALIALGCVRQQGPLYAQPLNELDFENYLVQHMAEGMAEAERPPTLWDTDELS